VANLNMDIQAKLLRAIETHEFKPVGASRLKKADVRFIAATNRDLKTMVEEGTFREDLFYRLNVFPIVIPPLRERRDDIPRLLYHFLRQTCRQTGKRVDGFSDESLEMLVNHDWPGNVRQLKNVVARLVIIADSPVLECQHLSDHWETEPEQTRDDSRKSGRVESGQTESAGGSVRGNRESLSQKSPPRLGAISPGRRARLACSGRIFPR
jgi:DNA-binding NtrC family response regulator